VRISRFLRGKSGFQARRVGVTLAAGTAFGT